MTSRTPAYIADFLQENLHRFDLGTQYLGDEPNADRKPWDTATVRWCMVASWPYEAAAGNSSIPAVYKTINNAGPNYLCDRFYLPATPRDLKLLERARIPIFGIESRHQLADFDVVGSSIAYPVLTMSWVKMLSMSDIPLRWRDRTDTAGQHPMVIVGGQSYGAPETLAPVVDCWWLGEVEEEPGNPGMGDVLARIAHFKDTGQWTEDRIDCYADLAREFRFLYFPRFVDVQYEYEDRTHVGVPEPSKQVVAITSNLEGMPLPRTRRYVKELDNSPPLADPPLSYADPSMGAGDLEVARGSVSEETHVLIEGQGLRRLGAWQGDDLHPHGADFGVLRCDVAGQLADVTHVLMNGVRPVVSVRTVGGHEVAATPDHEISVVRGPAVGNRATHVSYVPPDQRPPRAFEFTPGARLEAVAARPREWVRADQLVPGEDYIPVYYGQNVWSQAEQPLDTDIALEGWGPNRAEWTLPAILDEDVAWFLGMLAGDTSIKSNGDVASTVGVSLRMRTEDDGVRAKADKILQTLFGRQVEPYARNPEKPVCLTFEIRSVVIMRWLARNFGVTDKLNRRRVPDLILKSPRPVVAAYLSGFYDSDGTYDDRTGRPSWGSQSEELIRVVSLLLLNLGAPCSWRALDVGRKRCSRSELDRRFARVQGLQAEDGDWSWLQPSHTRRLPHVRRWQQGTGTRKGREAYHGVIYTPVAAVEPVGEVRTYDLSVPGLTSFTGNGIHVHNCPAWCTFCSLSYLTKPYRQRSVENVIAYAGEFANNMGSVRLAPFSPDFPMYTQRKKLIAGLLENVSDEVDAPTMRVDDFIADNEFILLQVHGGMDTVTLGVEGNSQRMRDLVGKGTSDEDVKEAVTRGIRAGIRKFKLYMISNLPGEDEGDMYRILKLAKDLADIRESMNRPTVRIQFSWTPLMIEMATPFQWFAPTPGNRILGDIWEELRELKIEFKIGSKGEPNKAAFFQLIQRASRDVGEALVDAMEEANQACWGGVPRTFRDTIEDRLLAHGFHNGYADCFDERHQSDMFGTEMVDPGVSKRLLWTTYLQMREFVENTDSHTYDTNFDHTYHGSEWLDRCDSRCYGKSCGACDRQDLEIRRGYLHNTTDDTAPDLSAIVAVDQRTQAVRVRARLRRGEQYRLVDNAHWRFVVRRAAFRAQAALGTPYGIAKRSIRFASDEIRHRDWTSGVDYVEFDLTRRVTGEQVDQFIAAMNDDLGQRLPIEQWSLHSAGALTMRAEIGLHLVQVEVDADPAALLTRLRQWDTADHVPMRLHVAGGYFAPSTEEVNAKDYVDALWAVRDGIRLKLRMLISGRPSPYNIVAAVTGRTSWLETAKLPAERLDIFVTADRRQQDFLRPTCQDCALQIPSNILDQPYDLLRCPRCRDRHDGLAFEEMTFA